MVAGILPWNFPVFLLARKMAPALVAGNTIVVKSSEATPLNAFDFTELLAECGLPKGCSTWSPAAATPAPAWPSTKTWA